MDSELLINEVLKIAHQAGQEILKVYQEKDFSKIIDFKEDNSPLTHADTKANKVIEDGLKLLSPQTPILSEEGQKIAYEERKKWLSFWLVDPLDGTKEFIKRNGEFTVNIALIENEVPIFGVIYAPVLDVFYWGGKTVGAFKKSNHETTPIKVSKNIKALTSVSSRSHGAIEERISEMVTNYLAIGSSLKFCWVAEGKADFYLRDSPTMEWDTAAGQAILEGAGGLMTASDGKPFLYNKEVLLNSSFFCSNGMIVLDQLLQR
ncbi:MAG: 3'(2'),5'-bisphosphate nucleotidase [Cytophagales bacterium]|nr:MAG: 3'(2'),5'-bisphosphate nucleotidase [Cytophagales bacterium]